MASPMRNRASGGSGRKRSRSSGVVNGREAPSAKKAMLDGSQRSSSGIPSSSHNPAMWRSLVNRWW